MPRLTVVLLLLLLPYAHASGQQRNESLAATVAGRGTAVVIVPGVLGSAYGFRKVMPGLVADDFRVAVIDPLGFGASPRPDGADYSFSAQANRLYDSIERLGLEHPILVCHALSGTICLRLAYRHPEMVRAIVSINGGASEQTGTVQLRLALKLAHVVLFVMGEKFAVHELHKGLIESAGDTTWVSDSVVANYVKPFGTDSRVVVSSLQQIVSAHEPEALNPNLPRVRAPELLLFGTAARDPKNPTMTQEERTLLRTRLPHFQEQDVPGAGEYIQEEKPEVVVAAVRRIRDQTK